MISSYCSQPLGQICDVLDSRRVPITKSDRVSGTIPYYGATGILDYVQDFLFDEKLVLVGEDGAKWDAGDQTAFIVEGKCWVNNHAHVLRPRRSKVMDEWIAYHLNFSDLSPYITGLTVPKLNQGRLCEIPIPLPPLPEQQRIVTILDGAFDGIAVAAAKAQKNLKNARALFDSYLNSIFCADGKWIRKRLDKICHIGDGNHSSKYPKNSEMVATGVPFIRSANIENGTVSSKNMTFISKEKHAELRKGHLKAGDVLFTNRGEIGKLAIVGPEFDGSNLNSQIAWLRCSSEVRNRFLFYFLQSPSMQLQFTANQTGTALQQFTVRQIREVMVEFPSAERQNEIVHALDTLAANVKQLRETYRQKIEMLAELKQSLLAKAFAGELT